MSDPVLNLLSEKGLQFIVSGKDYVIRCLNPEHDDSSPSLRIDKVSGIAHCFACGWKRNLFKHYGVFTNNTPIRIQKLKEKIHALVTSYTELELPDGHTPYTQRFRGISPATLKHFEAFYTHDVEKLVDRIVFPIKDVSGKLLSFIGRHTLSDGNPRYVVYPSGTSLPLYPSVMPEGTNSIVLVEGIFDMLNLYDKGLRNAVIAFGTQALKKDLKAKLLPFKVQGITKIFLMFDGDKAGREAMEELQPLLEEENFTVERIDLPDGTDPGELDQESVDGIKEYTK